MGRRRAGGGGGRDRGGREDAGRVLRLIGAVLARAALRRRDGDGSVPGARQPKARVTGDESAIPDQVNSPSTTVRMRAARSYSCWAGSTGRGARYRGRGRWGSATSARSTHGAGLLRAGARRPLPEPEPPVTTLGLRCRRTDLLYPHRLLLLPGGRDADPHGAPLAADVPGDGGGRPATSKKGRACRARRAASSGARRTTCSPTIRSGWSSGGMCGAGRLRRDGLPGAGRYYRVKGNPKKFPHLGKFQDVLVAKLEDRPDWVPET